jgi:hypothetical protein
VTGQLFDTATGGAELSDDGTYRYRLWRGTEPRLGFVMCNPSIADATTDHTITRCRSIARTNGYAGIDVCNLFAYRATKPGDLPADLDTATGGARNLDAIIAVIADVDTIVAAWGNTYAVVAHRLRDGDAPGIVLDIANAADVPVRCLGVTANGHPRHPSRIGNVPLVPWPVPVCE